MSKTDCHTEELRFEDLGRRKVVGKFDGGPMSSDAGALLLREADRMFDVIGRFAACFTDHRDPSRVEHTVEAMLRQRVYAICLGYEDVNDHDRLRDDPVLAMGVGCEDVTGAHRARERDQGHPLASSSTLNRLELGSKGGAASHRYKRIVADPEKIDTMLADLFMDVTGEEPEHIVLDLDATDDAIHGQQEGRFFHGYYGHYCYLPLYIVSGKHVLAARLRPSNIDASAGTIEELAPVIARIRARWPQVPIWIRADAGFCRDDIMAWCEAQGLHYIIGMPLNARLKRIVEEAMEQSQATCEASGQPSRRFRSFEYQTKDSWSCARRVIAKAEWLPGPRGYNARFVVTNFSEDAYDARTLYEDLYCARGDMENRLKEQQLTLFADRTSTSMMESNQLRLYFSTVANTLMTIIKTFGLQGTAMAQAQCATIRVRLLKIAALVVVSVRRVRLLLPEAYPWQQLFARVLNNLRGAVHTTQVGARASPS